MDSAGNTTTVVYDSSAQHYVATPPLNHPQIIILPPPGVQLPGLKCILDTIAGAIYLSMVRAELDYIVDLICNSYGSITCLYVISNAEMAYQYYQTLVDNWLNQQGCG
jgi:hypothetical protein